MLCGVVSFGAANCNDSRIPGVYTRVSEYHEWIKESIPEGGGPWDDGLECLPATECADVMSRKAVIEVTSSEIAKQVPYQPTNSFTPLGTKAVIVNVT